MGTFTFSNGISRCRSLLVAVFASVSLAASGQSMQVIDNITDGSGASYQLMSQAISPNHRYIAGIAIDYDTYEYGAFVYDLETEAFAFFAEVDLWGADLRAVNDDGEAVGYNGPGVKVSIDGTVTELETPDGCRAYPMDMSDDGLVAGYYYYETDYMSHACVWKDGQLVNLPEPTSEDTGFDVYGSEAYYMSADGSIIAGYLVDYISSGTFVVWRMQDDGSYVCDLVYSDYFSADGSDPDHPYTQFTPTGLSRNGKYASVAVATSTSNQRMARYDLETRDLEVYIPDGSGDISSDATLESGAVADDGTITGTVYTGNFMSQKMKACLWYKDADSPVIVASLSDAFADMANFDEIGGNFITDITPDGTYLTGYGYDEMYNYNAYVLSFGDVTTAIDKVEENAAGQEEIARYTLDGVRISAPVKGINIVKRADGSTVKVVVK